MVRQRPVGQPQNIKTQRGDYIGSRRGQSLRKLPADNPDGVKMIYDNGS